MPSIFQGKLEFDATAGISLSTEHPFERHAFRVLGAVLALLIFGYMYFISASVLNVMARKEALAQVTQSQGAIAALEEQYFSLSHSVTPDSGASIGLSKVSDVDYVYRPGNVGSATIARNAI